MLGEGLISVDDYIKFGEFVDKLMRAGVKYWSFCAVKREVLIWVGKKYEADVLRVLKDYNVISVKEMRGTKLYRVKWD